MGDEHIAAIEHELRDELPGDEAEGDEGQEAVHVAADQRHVDEAQAENESANADGDPERPEQRTAIALPDVVQADCKPQLAIIAPASP